MRTFISIQNQQAEQFEQVLEEFDFLNDVITVIERDFMTDFIFKNLNEEEEHTLENLKNNLN